MRKIEYDMIAAIQQGKNFNSSNTMVKHESNTCRVFLHGNEIYREVTTGNHSTRQFTLSGWNTNTTKSRLRALIKMTSNYSYLETKKGNVFYRGVQIKDNEWVDV